MSIIMSSLKPYNCLKYLKLYNCMQIISIRWEYLKPYVCKLLVLDRNLRIVTSNYNCFQMVIIKKTDFGIE